MIWQFVALAAWQWLSGWNYQRFGPWRNYHSVQMRSPSRFVPCMFGGMCLICLMIPFLVEFYLSENLYQCEHFDFWFCISRLLQHFGGGAKIEKVYKVFMAYLILIKRVWRWFHFTRYFLVKTIQLCIITDCAVMNSVFSWITSQE